MWYGRKPFSEKLKRPYAGKQKLQNKNTIKFIAKTTSASKGARSLFSIET